ncbi:MAG: hypothetical protein OEM81_10055 [Acidimicrobiia bacterium]|nr:hypothetical protein [Acidimicrobiia bacterium]MDH5615928.1 hypothetical protein [Acidimicrobiia bacterium]
MPWFWTDDLAELLVEHANVRPETLVDWTRRPVALSVPEGAEPLEFARKLLGVETGAVA